ncbi:MULTISPECIES: hypothetical protein [unclassified Chryseobacterium]|uniref:hypothetical protein n=1 Tax=unclassified Chryseobacterium TaxID=2593645 RepID=UPI00100B2069|nr:MULTISPECIES: hypothetical protein [unclassified Chryseobacterium]RXM52010.1 hypothetical protein BOQ64_09140 [Chryseobacterium sp. CH25]RXM63930.1 hypothetical protein BOQ60_13515 [Chryseobacterium sp. CH1]
MRYIVSFLFVVFSSFVAAQELPSPPAMSNLSKQRLIDEFIEVSYYKEALNNYAREYLELKMFDYSVDPPKQKLTKEQVQTIIKNFNFDDFKISLYSSFSFISEENLKNLIKLHKNIGGQLSGNNSVLLMTPAIDLNIKNQMDYAIENIK